MAIRKQAIIPKDDGLYRLESTVSGQSRIVKNVFNRTILNVNLYSIDQSETGDD